MLDRTFTAYDVLERLFASQADFDPAKETRELPARWGSAVRRFPHPRRQRGHPLCGGGCAVTLDRHNPEAAIAEAAKAFSNWGRWGEDDVLGTLNYLDEAKRREGAALIRRGVSFSLAQPFDMNGPQKGWLRRTNPVHTMLDTGMDAALGHQPSRTASAAPTT